MRDSATASMEVGFFFFFLVFFFVLFYFCFIFFFFWGFFSFCFRFISFSGGGGGGHCNACFKPPTPFVCLELDRLAEGRRNVNWW